jgi:CheY-like chemotaxis protein
MDNIGLTASIPSVVPYWLSMSMPQLNVLVVEDNAESRTLLSDMLALLGHKVHAVESAEDALALLAQQQFDVLLTDINLPGMSGVELAQAAVEIMPPLKVIFASGFGFLVVDNDRINFDFLLLSKPYSLMQLKDAMGRIGALVSKFKRATSD